MDADATPSLSRFSVDPASHRRLDDAWLAEAWADPAARVLVLEGGDPGSHGWRALMAKQSRALVTTGPTCELVFTTPRDAPEGERYLLGTDGEHVYFAVRSTRELAATPQAEPASLREVGALLGDRDTGLLTRAVALANWNATHGFCPRCGSPTTGAAAGHVRVCEREGSEQYPRMDPAVIMLVHRERDGREEMLLGNNPKWDARRFSVLAGFVDAGESLEQAVVREVAEEVGIVVERPCYLSSQPWPFPRSLMVGYTARAVGETERTDDEIAVARWFTRPELAEAVHSEEIVLPGRVSIARTLIEHWYGAELPGGW
ncbi:MULTISPECIES: NAD(+) diphosphatase [Nocardiopsis]|uniref:NAD(+) diphosphatase n=1 Tax=Nocardiopsis sinuspersici TaxID=501010 RepID=A0A1V3C4B0_9ACTN|nr:MULTISPECIES: NAD(+) diphosphatase [Nocardiopsis]NYH51774.1 NAD+ diphosphatase [Nocardiopsis sinuspersici]OOC55366.1 NADH pyrophosphatase [Nocardiopsis sinuspersici]